MRNYGKFSFLNLQKKEQISPLFIKLIKISEIELIQTTPFFKISKGEKSKKSTKANWGFKGSFETLKIKVVRMSFNFERYDNIVKYRLLYYL